MVFIEKNINADLGLISVGFRADYMPNWSLLRAKLEGRSRYVITAET